MEPIKVEVAGNIARVIEKPQRITAGTVGWPIEFLFDRPWDGLRKTAVFRVHHSTRIVENLETETTVPWELLQKPGAWLSVGVYGVNLDGSVAIPTIWANVCPISDGADPEADPGADPSLPVYQKLLDDVDDIEEVIDDIFEIQNELMNGADIEVVPSVHLEDTSNPHGVTAEQVGARSDEWMPTAEEVGARPDTWIPTAEEVGAAPSEHVEDTDNPHSVTAEQVGARPDTWMPTAKEVGATPYDHAEDVTNPHSVTAEQVGALPLFGGIMTGALDMGNQIIKNAKSVNGANIFGCKAGKTDTRFTFERNGTSVYFLAGQTGSGPCVYLLAVTKGSNNLTTIPLHQADEKYAIIMAPEAAENSVSFTFPKNGSFFLIAVNGDDLEGGDVT